VVQVKKREKESSNSLIRRFARRVQQSGLLIQARRNRFFERSKSPKKLKKEALRREEIKTEKEKLRKLGKLEDEFGKKRKNY